MIQYYAICRGYNDASKVIVVVAAAMTMVISLLAVVVLLSNTMNYHQSIFAFAPVVLVQKMAIKVPAYHNLSCRRSFKCNIVSLHAFQPDESAVAYTSSLLLSPKTTIKSDGLPLPEVVSNNNIKRGGSILIHWRGEDVEGYSLQFRHIEYTSAIAAEMYSDDNTNENDISQITFSNALNYTGLRLVSSLKINGYNQAIQYMYIPDSISIMTCIRAAKRCSLIHAIYEIVAETDTNDSTIDSYNALAKVAIDHNAFADMYIGQVNANHTWCVRVRHYGNNTINDNDNENILTSKERRYGERSRSLTLERRALTAFQPILCNLGGKVNLHNPDCKIYVFDGLLPQQVQSNESTNMIPSVNVRTATKLVLTRRIGSGARQKVYAIYPTSRICITNTPLCPVSSFIMANIARVCVSNNKNQKLDNNFAVLDPYCGSAGTLLAVAMILQTSMEMRRDVVSPSTTTTSCAKLVGIEICHDGIVNRDDIRQDFITRNWTDPVVLLHGDSTDASIRRMALDAIGGQHRPFDAIISDPPYGIRESNNGRSRPIIDLLQMIIDDRNSGTPLLRIGGRLVVFIPQRIEDETLDDIMPSEDQLHAAGLQCEYCNRQYLNDQLYRWLISYVCIQ